MYFDKIIFIWAEGVKRLRKYEVFSKYRPIVYSFKEDYIMAFAGIGISVVGLFFSLLEVPVLMLLSFPMALGGLILSVMTLRKNREILTIIGVAVCAVLTIYLAVVWAMGIGAIAAFLAEQPWIF